MAGMTSEQERFDDFIRQQAADLRPAPSTPVDQMWSAITAERRARAQAAVAERRRARWGLGIAAVLLLGVAIGRMSAPDAGKGPPGAGPVADADGPSVIYQAAAAEYLGRAEALLTMFRLEARAGRTDEQTSGAAQRMLTTSRLLMDSPVASDPQMRRLLEDLELVLAQIARLSAEQGADPAEFVLEALENNSVLFRLRAVNPPALSPVPAEGAL
jgi:hypothetical protein